MRKQETSIVNKIFVISLCVLLSVYALSILFTLWWGLLSSFKSVYDYDPHFNANVLGFPTLDESNPFNSIKQFWGLENYKIIINDYHKVEEKCVTTFVVNGEWKGHKAVGGFPMAIMNTFVYTVVGAALHTIIPLVTAYAVAKYENPVGRVMTAAALFAMTMPIVGNQASMLTMLRNMGLYDTFAGYLLQKATYTGMYFFVFSAFFQSLPNSFSEAAEIDGASQYGTLIRIIIPLSAKMFSTVFLIQFIHFWNDYQTAYLYMPSHPTLAYAVWFLTTNNQSAGGGDLPPRTAAAMMLAVPILVTFIILKDKLMGNLSMGGLKE